MDTDKVAFLPLRDLFYRMANQQLQFWEYPWTEVAGKAKHLVLWVAKTDVDAGVDVSVYVGADDDEALVAETVHLTVDLS